MEKQRVFVTRSDFPDNGIKLLREKYTVDIYPHEHQCPQEYILQHVKGCSAIFCVSTDNIDEAVIEAAGPQLKVIATYSLGFEHIDVEECKKRDIKVCNAANPVSVSCVAEFTIGLLLAVCRRIVEASGAIQRNEWADQWTPSWYVSRGLTDASVGIVGMGKIGQAILDRIVPFGVAQVYYYDIYHPIDAAESKGACYVDFEELLRKCDYVIVTCNLTKENKGLFDEKAFSLMKPSAVFINTSRGQVVKQEALVDALKNNRIKAAGIDVMYPEPLPKDHELASLPNVVITPHIAAAEETALKALSEIAAKNIIAVLEGKPPLTPVY